MAINLCTFEFAKVVYTINLESEYNELQIYWYDANQSKACFSMLPAVGSRPQEQVEQGLHNLFQLFEMNLIDFGLYKPTLVAPGWMAEVSLNYIWQTYHASPQHAAAEYIHE